MDYPFFIYRFLNIMVEYILVVENTFSMKKVLKFRPRNFQGCGFCK